MDIYSTVKAIHILSSTILFGTGLGIAFFFFQSRNEPNIAARYFSARNTVMADYIFTLPAVIIQPLTGFWLIDLAGYNPTEAWLVITYIIYILAGLCWVPVVFIQIRLRNILKTCSETKCELPDEYFRLFRLWFMLGWPAFIGLVAVFFLMVLKPTW